MATKAKQQTDDLSEIQIMHVDRGQLRFRIIGDTPLIMNSMSAKSMTVLLAPKGKKTAIEKAGSVKHDPLSEYRDSCYFTPKDAPTALGILNSMFKGAICNAALDLPGAKKTQIGRLTSVEGSIIPVYGVPQIFCSVVRSADMNKTPDVRTRAILPRWACELTVSFIKPVLREQSIMNLIAGAGLTVGIGDWRQQKGSGNYGLFHVCDADDKEWAAIVKSGGRKAQEAALEHPDPHDKTTGDLLAWYAPEMRRRGFRTVTGDVLGGREEAKAA